MSGWGPSLERLRASRWGVAGEVDVGKALLHHPNHCLDRSGESGLVLQTRPTVFDFLSLRIEKQNGWRKTKLWTVPIGRRNLWIYANDSGTTGLSGAPGLDVVASPLLGVSHRLGHISL